MTNKILLIDDSKTQLDILKLRFIKSGFEVETAIDANEGYQKIYSFIPDVILSDVIMPNLDGYQFCRLLKNNKLTKNIPVVLLTVLDKKTDKFWGKNSGAQAFISKTAEFETIKEKTLQVIKESNFSQEDRENLKNNIPSHISMKEQMNNVLNNLLMQSVFMNEFRNLGEYYSQEKVLVEKSFEFLSTFIDYDIAGIFFNKTDNSVKNTLYIDTKNNNIQTLFLERIKREFYSKMPNLKEFNSSNFVYEVTKEANLSDDNVLSPNSISTSFILPIINNDILLGGIAFWSKNQTDYKDFKFYDIFLKELLTIFKMRFLYSKVEFLSVTDGLTGLYNRRHFEYNIEREFLRAKRYKNDLSVAIIDIDYFKKINDTYGHQFGDFILKEVSMLMKESFRKTDITCRYGGEEFVIIMPETSLENALIPAERLREKIQGQEFCQNGQKTNFTISIGISSMSSNFNNQQEIIELADKALYEAKNSGRNRVVINNG